MEELSSHAENLYLIWVKKKKKITQIHNSLGKKKTSEAPLIKINTEKNINS